MKNLCVWLRAFSLILLIAFNITLEPARAQAASSQFDLPTPANSGQFGLSVTELPNGNFVVTDPDYPFYTDYTEARGAVYMYAPNGMLISRLIGSQIGNSVGSGGITVLANGNFVVNSPFWDSPTTDGVGAVTWCSQQTGCNGAVSASNSLVGSSSGDLVGYGGVTALSNGNFVVSSPHWFRGGAMWAGAVTWGSGSGATTGVVSEANSWVGSSMQDNVGEVMPLTNGSYLVLAPGWDNGSIHDAGAVTWGNGMGGSHGVISAANSLTGSSASDSIGNDFWGRIVELANGNYVVLSPLWDLDTAHPDRGAVTWGSGTAGVAGPVSAANSLIGNCDTPVSDVATVTPLTDGNYVVGNTLWSPDGNGKGWGAVTWGSGSAGVSGEISISNSLVGSADGDNVGFENFFSQERVIPLSNGNYVVTSYAWNDAQGAVTWGNGGTGIRGPVSSANSLIGSVSQVIALTNGDYVVAGSTVTGLSAVTWGDGAIGISGPKSVSNSLVSAKPSDSLGDGGLVALTNGNYVVVNTGLGSVTWVDGSHAAIGTVSLANSLSGGTPDDQVGSGGVIALTNGNFVVISPNWDNGSLTDAGAITWGNGASGTAGTVSPSNSLVGASANDQLGSDWWHGGLTILTNGNYVVSAPQWDNQSAVDAGAVTWGNGAGGTVGPVSPSNSLVGSKTGDLGVQGPFGGDFEVIALPGGDYAVDSPHWSGAAATGSFTWADGSQGMAGAISPANSLVNTCPGNPTQCDPVVTAWPGDNVSLLLPNWSDGSRYGAISLITGLPDITVGAVSAENSVFGSTLDRGSSIVAAYDPARVQWIVGRPWDSKVTIFRGSGASGVQVFLPHIIK